MEQKKKNPALDKAERITVEEVVSVETSPMKKRDNGVKKIHAEKRAEKIKKHDKNQRKDKDGEKPSHNERVLRAGVGVLALSTAILGGALAYRNYTIDGVRAEMDSVYKKSFYSTVDYVDELDLNIDKYLVTADSGTAQGYLAQISTLAELAEDNFQQLPLADENKFYTAKLINQVGDYAKYLNKKIIDGAPVLDEDIAAVRQLSQGVKELKRSLADMSENLIGDFSFENMKEKNFVLSGFEDLQKASVKYPALIYDGPFSDGRDKAGLKGLVGEEISVEYAVKTLEKTFASRMIKDVKAAGEVSGRVPAYCFTAKVDGAELYAQVSKVGGKVLMFTVSSNTTKSSNARLNLRQTDGLNDSKNENMQERSDRSKDSEDISAGENFLASLGLTDMKAVWTAKSDGVSVINFAYFQDGVIVYSDLIKVKVENATVTGMECFDYYLNHAKRDIVAPVLTEEQALEKVAKNLSVKNGRLALIPLGESEELTYEFMAEENGATYYIYISAISGRQVQTFKVVEGTEGTLLR